MRSADPVAAVTPVSARVTGHEPITAKTAVLWCVRNEDTERVIRNIEPMMEGHRGLRRGGSIPCLHPERHQLSGDRCDRRAALRCAEGEMAGPPRTHLPAAHRQHRLQGGQRFRLLHALGRGLRTRRHARRRFIPDRGLDPAHGAHHAGRSEAWHSAKSRRRHAIDQRVRAHLPVRHAARHALLHARQRVVAGRLRSVLGPQRDPAPRAVHRALPHPAAARTARTSSATTRSRRC